MGRMRRDEKFDWRGSVIYGVALALFHVWIFTASLYDWDGSALLSE
ncbi:MAG: hypothetical protein MZV63_46435 [Marinilabiliales bacterium]|nr:hypothetical protein [Marinilabiliales bacterium]